MLRPRWLARFLAFVGGYFWLPCPLCNQMFAGFEVSHLPFLDMAINRKLACENCTDLVRKHNDKIWNSWIGEKHVVVDPAVRNS